MAFRINVGPSAPSLFAGTVDRAVDAARIDAGDGAANQAATVGATALKRLAQSWPLAVGATTIAGSIGASDSGSGFERITLDLWRSS